MSEPYLQSKVELTADVSEEREELSDAQEKADEALVKIEEQFAQDQADADELVSQLEASRTKSSSNVEVMTSAVVAAGDANKIVKAASENANLEAQNATIDAFALLGGKERQAALLTEYREDQERTSNLLDKKVDISNDSFTGLGIIDEAINEFRSVQLDAEIEAARAKEAHTLAQITGITQSTSSAAQTAELTKKTRNEDTIKNNLLAMQAETDLKVARVEMESLHSNASNLSQIFRLKRGQLEHKLAGYKMRQDQVRAKIQSEASLTNLAIAKKSLAESESLAPLKNKLQEELTKNELKKLQDVETVEAEVIESVHRAETVAGVPLSDPALILHNIKQGGAVGDKYEALYLSGSVAEPVIANSPGKAKAVLDIVAPTGGYKKTKATKALDFIEVARAQKYAKVGAAKAPTKADAILKDFDAEAARLSEEWRKIIDPRDENNPFNAPPMSVLGEMEEVKNSPLFQKVLAPLGLEKTDPQEIVDYTLQAIEDQAITMEEGIDGVHTIFSSAVLYNNAMEGGMERVGFDPQISYNALLVRDASFGEALATGMLPNNAISMAFNAVTFDQEDQLQGLAKINSRMMIVDLADRTALRNAFVRLRSSANLKPSKKGDQGDK